MDFDTYVKTELDPFSLISTLVALNNIHASTKKQC
jgi:hypothetical protein